MTKKLYLFLLVGFFNHVVIGQTYDKIPVPTNLEQGYPRLYITENGKKDLEKTIKKESWAQAVLKGIHSRIDVHVDRMC